MTLIIGARCQDGVILAADRRRISKYERGPSTTKLSTLSCGVAIAGAGDDAVLNEARVFMDRRIEELQSQTPITSLFDLVEVSASVVNELVSFYKGSVEEPFGYVMSGLESLISGKAQLYTLFGAGISDVPWVCLGSGSSYARPLVNLVLSSGTLHTDEAIKTIPTIFSLVSNVQTSVGDGIDICIAKDNHALGTIVHKKEVNLDRLRVVFLDTVGVQSPEKRRRSRHE